MSGRAAEEIIINDSITEAQNDLKTASELAGKMVWDYGMGEELDPFPSGKKRPVLMGLPRGSVPI